MTNEEFWSGCKAFSDWQKEMVQQLKYKRCIKNMEQQGVLMQLDYEDYNDSDVEAWRHRIMQEYEASYDLEEFSTEEEAESCIFSEPTYTEAELDHMRDAIRRMCKGGG